MNLGRIFMKKHYYLGVALLSLSLIAGCNGKTSDDHPSTTISSSNNEQVGVEKKLTITSDNFNKFDGITLVDVVENTKYPEEFTFNANGSLTTSAITDITQVKTHVYGTYDNMKMYAGTSTSGTLITATSEPSSDGKSVYYTYSFASKTDSFYLLNSSSEYRVHLYSIEITYTGVNNLKANGTVNPTPTPSGDVKPDPTPIQPDKNGWTNNDFNNYYSSINLSLNGNQLLNDLRSLNSAKKTKNIGYKNLWNYYDKTDYDPNHSGKYLAFYRGTSASRSDMNKEHVWPNSRGGNLVEGDIHMPRPTLTSDNSSRGNSFYVEGKDSSSAGWDPKAAGMNEQYRGQAARILFYCVVANNQLSLVDKDNDSTGNKTMGKLSDLLKWNLQYGVDESELRRNNGAQEVQGNRNPFIDNPSFACSIFGSTNETTKKICAGQSQPSTPTPTPSEDVNPDPTPTPDPSDDHQITLTVDNLNLPSQSYTSATASINTVSFEFTQLGNYGNGIQMRDKVDKGTSILYNTSAFSSGISKITLQYAATMEVKYSNPDSVIFNFGNDAQVNGYTTKLSTVAGTKTYTITPDVSTYTYFKLEHDCNYSFYWDSITIYLTK